jgi:hypothetical protein
MNRPSVARTVRSPFIATILLLALAGSAFATVASNFSPIPAVRGTLADSIHINAGEIKFQTKGPVDFVTTIVTIGAPGSSGWHTHPGIVLVSVTAGSLMVYDANCVATAQATGSAFVESGDSPLLVRNEGSVPAVVHVTYLEPAGTTALRIDQGNPGCPQF